MPFDAVEPAGPSEGDAAEAAGPSIDAPAGLAALEIVLRHVQDAVLTTDLDDVVTFWGDSAERMFEWRRGDAVGRAFSDLLPTRLALSDAATRPMDAVRSGRTWRGEGLVRLPSGRELWIESTISPVIEDGIVTGSVSVCRDMTATRASVEAAEEVRLQSAERARLFAELTRYATAANSTHEEERLYATTVEAVASLMAAPIVELTVVDRISGRPILREVRGLDPAVVGSEIPAHPGTAGRALAVRSLVIVEAVSAAEAVGTMSLVADERGGGTPSADGAAGSEATASNLVTSAATPLIHDGAILGVISVTRPNSAPFSESEREALVLLGAQTALAMANTRLFAEVSELAVHDGLTGLYNRRHFDASLDLLLARWRRERPSPPPIAAIMFDLDHFGRLNRDHGHQAGDAVLRAFGGILHERLRSSDLVARYGGEEFVAVLERATVDDAVLVAREVCTTLRQRATRGRDGATVRATVSAGCAQLDPHEPTPDALLRAADIGLFMAKRAGRDRVAVA